jgi:hypothetical protein
LRRRFRGFTDRASESFRVMDERGAAELHVRA